MGAKDRICHYWHGCIVELCPCVKQYQHQAFDCSNFSNSIVLSWSSKELIVLLPLHLHLLASFYSAS